MDYDSLNGKPLVKIFWTGGWDSSYRIIELAKKDIVIQPYYLPDNRESEDKELNAIREIKDWLLKRTTTKSVFRPLIKLQSNDVRADGEITASYKNLRPRLGSQYDWLARFAKDHKGIELCVLRKPLAIINELGGEIKHVQDDTIGNYYIIDKAKSPKDIVNIYGNYRFPLLKMTKLEMKAIAERKGFLDLMDKTWFCFLPIDGEPCGRCNPCEDAIERGLSYRFTKAGIRRHQWKHSKVRKFLSKVKQMLLRLWRCDAKFSFNSA